LKIKSTTILIIIGIAGIGILSINTLDVLSADKKEILETFDVTNSAQSLFVTISYNNENRQFSFNTFSRIGVIKGDNPQFLLESVPSSDNKEFLKLVSEQMSATNSLSYLSNQKFFDVTIDVIAKNGKIIESLIYKKCTIDSYFVYTNDSKGTYSLLDDDSARAEVRDVSIFDCADMSVKV
jgi:hypothetical protein